MIINKVDVGYMVWFYDYLIIKLINFNIVVEKNNNLIILVILFMIFGILNFGIICIFLILVNLMIFWIFFGVYVREGW